MGLFFWIRVYIFKHLHLKFHFIRTHTEQFYISKIINIMVPIENQSWDLEGSRRNINCELFSSPRHLTIVYWSTVITYICTSKIQMHGYREEERMTTSGKRVGGGGSISRFYYKKRRVWGIEEDSTCNSSDWTVSSLTYHNSLKIYRAPNVLWTIISLHILNGRIGFISINFIYISSYVTYTVWPHPVWYQNLWRLPS